MANSSLARPRLRSLRDAIRLQLRSRLCSDEWVIKSRGLGATQGYAQNGDLKSFIKWVSIR